MPKGQYSTTTPRGRAAFKVRTGQFIKRKLEELGEAGISELHRAYLIEIADKYKETHPKAATYESFGKYFRLLRTLGLVEAVREEPIQLRVRASGKPLLSLRGTSIGTGKVVISKRVIYRLTAAGIAEPDNGAWANPIRALGYER